MIGQRQQKGKAMRVSTSARIGVLTVLLVAGTGAVTAGSAIAAPFRSSCARSPARRNPCRTPSRR